MSACRRVVSRPRVRLGSLFVAAAAIWSMGLGLPARAIDSPEPAAAPAADPLGPAREAVAGQRWADAIVALRKVNARSSADWNNLMGFALRKQPTPDLDGAQRYYDAALRIDPKHRGALEYAGELALMKGDLATATAHLAALARLCPEGCGERADLDKEIARYKGNGNRWLP